MTTGTRRTRNGQGIRAAWGWTWLCDHCHLSTAVHVPPDLEGFDADRWLAAVDDAHWCEHKR